MRHNFQLPHANRVDKKGRSDETRNKGNMRINYPMIYHYMVDGRYVNENIQKIRLVKKGLHYDTSNKII